MVRREREMRASTTLSCPIPILGPRPPNSKSLPFLLFNSLAFPDLTRDQCSMDLSRPRATFFLSKGRSSLDVELCSAIITPTDHLLRLHLSIFINQIRLARCQQLQNTSGCPPAPRRLASPLLPCVSQHQLAADEHSPHLPPVPPPQTPLHHHLARSSTTSAGISTSNYAALDD